MTTSADRGRADPLTRLPGYVLRRASSAAIAELNERLARLGLRHADVALLMLIDSRPDLTQSDAGRLLEIQRANMVPFVGRLTRRGLIETRQVDGRSRALGLSRAGRALLVKARRVVAAFERSLLKRVPNEMRPMVLPILTALWGRHEP
jgi:DNA-binding MarR family transcriptional regulator